MVSVAGLITSISLGARSTFGLYLDPVIAELGTGRSMFSLAVAIQNIVWGLSQPIAGAVAEALLRRPERSANRSSAVAMSTAIHLRNWSPAFACLSTSALVIQLMAVRAAVVVTPCCSATRCASRTGRSMSETHSRWAVSVVCRTSDTAVDAGCFREQLGDPWTPVDGFRRSSSGLDRRSFISERVGDDC